MLVEEWVVDFLEAAPELRGHMLGAYGHSGQHPFSLLTHGRFNPEGSLHFAGDYTSTTTDSPEAYRVGQALHRV